MPELRQLSFIELDKQMVVRKISGGAPVYPYTVYNDECAGFECLLDRGLPDANVKDMEDAQVKALALA